MPQEASSDQEVDDPDVEAFAEVDPSGRYGRYKEVLGKGAFKKVYRGFDEWEGIEVAWNQVKVSEIVRSSEDLERLYSEVHLLKTLKHKNIIKFYSSWVDTKHEHINFITEIFTSGTLRQYRKKHKRVDLRALKKWSRQILEGLVYLHSHDPPIIHRDLKCDNIFVNGNHGEVKIGDLGFAAILRHANAAHSVIGTPEFMAPELYEEEYNELVDIYAFGMCVLELVTFEYPYSECSNAAQIYKKVTSGVKPASLAKVKDSSVRAFIEKCIANVCERQSARQLLSDPFLISNEDADSSGRNLPINPVDSASGVSNKCCHGSRDPYHWDPEPSKEYKVEGQRKDVNTIYVKLKIRNSAGASRTILFPFDTEVDTSIAVASEMVHELDLTDQDVTIIADRIDSEIRSYIPDWSPRESFAHESGFDSHTTSEMKDDSSPLPTASMPLGGSLIFEQLPSGRKFWLDSPKVAGGNAPFTLKPSPLNPIRSAPVNPIDEVIEDEEQISSSPGDKNIPNDDSAHTDSVHASADADNVYASELDEKLVVENDLLNTGDNVLEDDKPLTDEVFSFQEPTMTSSGEEKDYGISETLSGTSESGKHVELLGCSGTGNEVALGCIESEEVRTVANKLEQLLQHQQKELEEMKLMHELAVSDLLKQLPHKVRCKVFQLCKYKIPDHRMHCESHLYAEDPNGACSFVFSPEASKTEVKDISQSTSSSTAGASLSYIKTSTDSPTVSKTIHLSKVKNPASGAEGFVVGPITRDKLNIMRGSKPDMGIAIILRDDSEKF